MFIHFARYYITTFAITTLIDPIEGLVRKKQTDPLANKKITAR